MGAMEVLEGQRGAEVFMPTEQDKAKATGQERVQQISNAKGQREMQTEIRRKE